MSRQVFISYARASSLAAACAVRDALEGAGISVFLDTQDIPPGSEFPQDIADALLGARVVLIFADSAYFDRPWCVYEYRVAVAPSRASKGDADIALPHIVMALPRSGGFDSIQAHVPPSVAKRAWPLADQHVELVDLVQQALRDVTQTLAKRLEGVDDEAVKALRTGGSVPRPSALTGCRGYHRDVPASLKERFIGRGDVLWRVFHTLETRRAGAVSLSCAILGGAGSGKTQIAAEYLWRYGPAHYPGGLVWINADCDEVTLQRQLSQVLGAFDPNTSTSESLESLPEAIERAVEAAARERAVLWIVDNVPEPTPESPILGISSWCPAWKHVSLLCTSRWRGIRQIDTRIQVDELAPAAAIEFLTQSPVDKAWLSYEEWTRIAEWVGALPLALETLRASLLEGFADAAELLARAREQEPAAAVDAEFDALRGEVFDEHLRGVRKALQISYEHVARNPDALSAAHLVARLSPYPFASEFLAKLVGMRERGILANRSWLQATEPPEDRPRDRYWRMHRIYASYLRGRSTDPEGELRDLTKKIQQMCGDDEQWLLLKEHSTHIVVLMRTFQRRFEDGALGAATLEGARQLSLALVMGPDDLGDGDISIRSYGAELADSLGLADGIVACLRKASLEGDEGICGTAAQLLGYMPRARSAAEFLVELLRDPRDRVRRRALDANLPSRHADILALPALEAILGEPVNNQSPFKEPHFFSNLLEQDVPTLPDGVIAILVERLWHAVDAEQRRALNILTGIYRKVRGRCEPGDSRLEPFAGALRETALHNPDEELATSAADALGDAGDRRTYDALVTALDAADTEAARLRAVDGLGSYLRGAESDELLAPRIEWRDGKQLLRVLAPERRVADRELFEPLVRCATAGGDVSAMERALKILLESKGGVDPVMDDVRGVYESGSFERLLEIAEAAIRVLPELATGYWWRGLAAEALERPDDAIADYGRVIELSPEFDQPYSRRADLHIAAGDLDGAMADINRLIELDPNDARLLFRRARVWFDTGDTEEAVADLDAAIALEKNAPGAFLLKGECLLRLERYTEAIDAISASIDLVAGFAYAWYLRAWARVKTGDLLLAMQAIEQVYQIEPGHGAATELLDAIRAGFAKLGPE